MSKFVNILVGYARKSNWTSPRNPDNVSRVKVNINVKAFNECTPYETSDGQRYVSLIIDRVALDKVLAGERAVTTCIHITEESE